jgi:hypothetical protein
MIRYAIKKGDKYWTGDPGWREDIRKAWLWNNKETAKAVLAEGEKLVQVEITRCEARA